MKHQNMKIEINDEQPLDEVVKELERLGYKKDLVKGDKWILCHEFGYYSAHSHHYGFVGLTTLQQLREMK